MPNNLPLQQTRLLPKWTRALFSIYVTSGSEETVPCNKSPDYAGGAAPIGRPMVAPTQCTFARALQKQSKLRKSPDYAGGGSPLFEHSFDVREGGVADESGVDTNSHVVDNTDIISLYHFEV